MEKEEGEGHHNMTGPGDDEKQPTSQSVSPWPSTNGHHSHHSFAVDEASGECGGLSRRCPDSNERHFVEDVIRNNCCLCAHSRAVGVEGPIRGEG